MASSSPRQIAGLGDLGEDGEAIRDSRHSEAEDFPQRLRRWVRAVTKASPSPRIGSPRNALPGPAQPRLAVDESLPVVELPSQLRDAHPQLRTISDTTRQRAVHDGRGSCEVRMVRVSRAKCSETSQQFRSRGFTFNAERFQDVRTPARQVFVNERRRIGPVHGNRRVRPDPEVDRTAWPSRRIIEPLNGAGFP